VSVLRFAGVRVPEDVSVTGYDDSDLAALSYLDLTTVKQDPDLSAVATLAAIRRRREDFAATPEDHPTTATLTVRGSTGPAPTRPPGPRPRVSTAGAARGCRAADRPLRAGCRPPLTPFSLTFSVRTEHTEA
jgi:hypothetical protein